MDDCITSYLLKTCLLKLLPRHSKWAICNCNDNVHMPRTDPTEECKWTKAKCDSACGWAVRIYESIMKELEAKKIEPWHGYHSLINCTLCEVERGCCKKMKLTLAMTSQILDWFKRHQDELNSINSKGQRILVYCRDQEDH